MSPFGPPLTNDYPADTRNRLFLANHHNELGRLLWLREGCPRRKSSNARRWRSGRNWRTTIPGFPQTAATRASPMRTSLMWSARSVDRRRPAKFLAERAERAQKNRDLEKAENLYWQYLLKSPDDLRDDHLNRAIKSLEDGLTAQPEKSGPRWILANLLARHGDTDVLLSQIRELENVGFALQGSQYLIAHYYVITQQVRKARWLSGGGSASTFSSSAVAASSISISMPAAPKF